ncbi:hypothetical protein [Pedobacter psychrodurus]|uniref:hypothetical protein n=1 Tax=Pedobacter psychrodurus TaxID=2530456 RepID=UPI00292D8FBC|nr:hypothetical protein [Pedobacter psychrodurus]
MFLAKYLCQLSKLIFINAVFSVSLLIFLSEHCSSQTTIEKNIAKKISHYYDTLDYNKLKTAHSIFNVNGKTIEIFGTNHAVSNVEDSMYKSLQLELDKLNPSVILTESYGIVFPDIEKTVAFGGESGFGVFEAFKRGTETHLWDNAKFGSVINQLLREYKREDVYITIVSFLTKAYTPRGITFEVFFSNIVTMMTNMGYPLTIDESKSEYFLTLYKKHFSQTYSSAPSESDLEHYHKVFKNGIFNIINNRYILLRDQNMLAVIARILKTHDKIFIICGAAHLGSMRIVLNSYLNNLVALKSLAEITSLSNLGDMPKLGEEELYIKELALGKKKVLFCGRTDDQWKSYKKMDATLKEKVTDFKPGEILVEGFGDIANSTLTPYKIVGESGLLRQIAIDGNIQVTNWERDFSYLYYALASTKEKISRHDKMVYPHKEVYSTIVLYNLIKNQSSISNFHTHGDFWKAVIQRLAFSNFPIQSSELDFNNWKSTSSAYLKGGAIVPDFQIGVNSEKLKPIVEQIRIIKVNELLDAVKKSLMQNERIVVQGDLKTMLAVEMELKKLNWQ